MIHGQPEQRYQGSLIAFIDLLFLLVAFFTLLLFFVMQKQEVTEQRLERTQQELAAVEEEKGLIEAAVDKLEPFMQQFLAQQRAEAEKRREAAARELRRRQRTTVRVTYYVTESGRISYEGTEYDQEAFLRQVVAPLRREHWIAFRAFAHAETPFGEVVRARRVLLENSSEFDTYWDNLTTRK